MPARIFWPTICDKGPRVVRLLCLIRLIHLLYFASSFLAEAVFPTVLDWHSMTNHITMANSNKIRVRCLTAGIILFIAVSMSQRIQAADIKHIEVDPATGLSAATLFDQGDRVYTGQLLPVNSEGDVVGAENVTDQSTAVITKLKHLLAANYSGLDRLLKINVYLAREADQSAVVSVLKSQLAGAHPAASFVVSRLPHPKALIAIDAIAVADKKAASTPTPSGVVRSQLKEFSADTLFAHATRFPSGRMIYISGQAEKGTLAEATKKTIQGLHKTLDWLGLDLTNVVQIKSFMKPMSEIAIVRKEIADLYQPQETAPPVVFVEWTNGLPIEIEMVVWAPAKKADATINSNASFHTPPWMKESNVYSRVAIAEAGQHVYISGLYGKPQTSGEAQVRSIFDQLQKILSQANSDLKHMVKATYYVSDDDSSGQLNAIRPTLYDPKRPPAASKAGVSACGQSGCSITVDMIAVTSKVE